MKELLPFCAGLAVGGGLSLVRPLARWLALPVVCVPVGAVMSWVNGEFGSRLWPLFVSFDALLVWAGATLALGALATRRRLA